MNREFTPTTKSSRLVIALAAVVSTLLVLGGIDGLAGHYSAPGAQLATTPADAPRA